MVIQEGSLEVPNRHELRELHDRMLRRQAAYYLELARKYGHERNPEDIRHLADESPQVVFRLLELSHGAGLRDEFIGLLEQFLGMLNRRGFFAEREKYAKKAIELAEAHGDAYTARRFWSSLGYTYLKQGQLVQARHALERTLELEEQIDHKDGRTFWQLAIVAFKEDNYEEAHDWLKKSDAAYQIARSGENLRRVWADNRYWEARILIAEGQYDKAQAILEENVREEESLSKPTNVARAHLELGHIAAIQGSYEEARQHYEIALRISVQWQDDPRVSEIKLGLARLEYQLGNLEAAYELAKEALQGFQVSQMFAEEKEADQLVEQLTQALSRRN